MLVKPTTTPAAPAMSFARVGYKSAAWLVSGVNCPHCTRQLRPTDMRADFGYVRLICAGCHHDIFIIESET